MLLVKIIWFQVKPNKLKEGRGSIKTQADVSAGQQTARKQSNVYQNIIAVL